MRRKGERRREFLATEREGQARRLEKTHAGRKRGGKGPTGTEESWRRILPALLLAHKKKKKRKKKGGGVKDIDW